MKTANMLAAAVFGASISLVAQQPGSSEPPPSSPPPPAAEQTSPATQAAPTNPATETPTAQMSPVTGELAGNLDSKTAKTGDSIVIKTKSAVTTTDGTQIPKGSKLIGHIAGVKASGPENANSQVALQFDRAELKSGQSVPIHSQIQSLAPGDSEVSASSPSAMTSAPSAPQGASAPQGGGATGSMSGGNPAAGSATAPSSSAPQAGNSEASPSAGTGIAAGTVVARSGNIAIRTTSIPGVLLAINEPGQQDPRMAQTSGILLGAKRDIHLDEGTNVVIGVSGAAATPGGN